MSADDGADRAPGAEPAHDAVRRLLARARTAPPAVRRTRRRPVPADQQWSGAGPDPRDPTAVGASVGELVESQHWARRLDAASLLPRWAQIVGPDLAAHCRPERLDGTLLLCVAESTAWATQVRLLSRSVLDRIEAEVGPGVVTSLRVTGPTAPDWRHGPLRVTGRGPRDTYG